MLSDNAAISLVKRLICKGFPGNDIMIDACHM